ncbi:uncharacterized protein A4U43_C10F18410 [Asparagus officinalis]|uniref:Uncharacterized protein n=1 Tax=Asparagus officinalis TaxID=4686 RepID=A0A5P1E8K8_ASPOF|nr:uncharacterized protein A4U43_C10F18410 [Asparagus officinalis]
MAKPLTWTSMAVSALVLVLLAGGFGSNGVEASSEASLMAEEQRSQREAVAGAVDDPELVASEVHSTINNHTPRLPRLPLLRNRQPPSTTAGDANASLAVPQPQGACESVSALYLSVGGATAILCRSPTAATFP